MDHHHLDDDASPLHMRRADRAKSAASRQKSCNACVRGKRRCDKTTPTCTRCAAKGLDCVYQRMPQGGGSRSAPPQPSSVPVSDTSSTATTTSTPMSMPGHQAIPNSSCGQGNAFSLDDFDMHGAAGMGVGGASGSCAGSGSGCPTASTETLDLDPALDFSITDMLGGAQTSWSLPFLGSPKADFPVPMLAEPPKPIRDVALLRTTPACVSPLDPLIVHDTRSSIGFVTDYVSKMPSLFASTRQLPFIHPRLYTSSPPRTIMSAFCAATAYANRTPETKPWTLQLVGETAREVVKDGRLPSPTPLERLARVQAMIVLDAIRLLDGDITLRSSAERDGDLLIEWIRDLVVAKDDLERELGLATTSKDHAPQSWESWILLECMRRTVVMASPVRCLVHLLKGECPDMQWVLNHSWTASQRLWGAATSVDFFRAWRESPQWRIENWEFEEFWMYARAEDLDEFTRVMLTCKVGPDTLEHYMHGDVGPQV